MRKLTKIKWEDLQIGDMFLDGSIVIDIEPWINDYCYKIETENSSLIISYKHVLSCIILDNEKRMVETSDFTKDVLKQIGQDDDNTWYTALDIYNAMQKGYDVKSLTENGLVDIKNIELYEDGKEQRVRCITTNTGYYQIGDFTNHNTGGKDLANKTEDIISNTFDGYRSSPIIQKALLAETTSEARQIIFEELKQEYKNNNIQMDDINIKMIAKKLTSYKRDKGVLRYVEDGEKCDIVSIGSIGNFGNPFKSAQLKSQYATLSKPAKFKYQPDAANEIVR